MLTLRKIVADDLALALGALGLSENKPLAREIQLRLIALGILDPPDDGAFGPISRLALHTFRNAARLPETGAIDASVARALLETDDDELFPLELGADFASRIVRAMNQREHWLARAPAYLNIVYVEGVSEAGAAIENKPNEWNDRRIVIAIEKGKPVIVGNWNATTEPGFYYTKNPISNYAAIHGVARIAFGQYKAWSVGTHARDHEALVQTGTLSVYRDKNADYKRDGDMLDDGDGFGINQHWGYDYPPEDIGLAGAGCLVGRRKTGHREFMALVKKDPRYVTSQSYRFMSTILDAEHLPA